MNLKPIRISRSLKKDIPSSTPRKEFVLEHQELHFIQGQRGKKLLVFDGFTFSINNTVENRIYWNCRSRKAGNTPCRARITTIKLIVRIES
ncbi:uncharacterized protein LOC129614547 [Condylostylus longicornis]|uniref:uncharacterized protein LOC129614547 n=1 Tax=Condylostylus longicornis TaxID=2530218 RepID=UPI00244E0412|nr:uncharacterized protein LOC129614547 [Condylostylus longicornis]